MKTMYDVMQLLKKHGIIIYTKDKKMDLLLMEEELREMYRWRIIDQDVFQKGLLILRERAKEI